MLKVLKFGGSSMADAQQYEKIKSIVEAGRSLPPGRRRLGGGEALFR